MMTLILLSLLGVFVSAAPVDSTPSCTNPKIRREWRELTIPERIDYIRAIQCMENRPPKSKKYFSVVQSRYDDFVALHANATAGGMKLDGTRGSSDMPAHPMKMANEVNRGIHQTGVFLPWHRYALSLWEDALRDECGWKGGLAFWDWHQDTAEAGGDWLQSPLFDPVSGYGGNGQRLNVSTLADLVAAAIGGTGGGCVIDGPFQSRKLSIGPMGQMMPNKTRCLTRNFNIKMAYSSASSKSMRKILSAKSMAEFRQLAETGVHQNWETIQDGIDSLGSMHNIGHFGIGGEMNDLFNSINDPLFFMHHTGMDRIWALWQEQDPKRIMDTGGTTGVLDMSPLTLDSWVWVGAAGQDRRTVEVMDPLNRDGRGVLCYKYEGNSFDSYFK